MKQNTIYKYNPPEYTPQEHVDYWANLKLYRDQHVLCLGEITNMPEHYIIVTKTGNVIWGIHDYDFEEVVDE